MANQGLWRNMGGELVSVRAARLSNVFLISNGTLLSLSKIGNAFVITLALFKAFVILSINLLNALSENRDGEKDGFGFAIIYWIFS
jgi:hypothetical protein